MATFQTYTVQTPAQLSVHIKSLRKARGMTQTDLGARIGVTQARVVDIENNPGSVSLDQLIQVLHALEARLLLADTRQYASPSPTKPPTAQVAGADW